MEENTKKELYRSGINELFSSERFIYSVELAKLSKGHYEVIDRRTFPSSIFLKVRDWKMMHYNGYHITKEIVLVGAPEHWLLKHNYKLVS